MMTPEILWALMFSYRCETVEVTYYEKRMTEITTRCVSTELTRHLLKEAADSRAQTIPDVPEVKPKVVKATKKVTKKKPTRKKKIRKKRSRRS